MNRRGMAVAIASLSLLISTAPSAHALAKRSAESQPQNALEVATANCRAGERVVSGGYRLDDPRQSDTPTTSRAAGKRGWLVKTPGEEFTAYALCSKQLKLTRAAAVVRVDSTDNRGKQATAKCARGSRAVSGGFQFSKTIGNSPIYRSKPAGKRGWQVLGVADVFPANALRLKVIAYCLEDAGQLVRRTDTEPAPDSADTYTTVATCRAGEELLSGGWTQTPRPDFDNALGPDIFFGLAHPRSRNKFAAGGPNFSAVAGQVGAIAICAK